MNKILEEIKKIINDNLKEYLPDIKKEDLEDNGAVYYMNGTNGTEWDYHVNEHLSPFMVFYNDKDKLGAVKLSIYPDGYGTLYLYDNNGKNVAKTIDVKIKAKKDDILKFATLLKKQMDDKNIWDDNIEKIDTSKAPTKKEIDEFKKAEKEFTSIKNRFSMLHKIAYVSRKISDEGYKVGYMCKEEPLSDNDSGWQFMAGNEDDEYINDSKNIAIMSVNELYQIDKDIWNYIDSPVGASFIRISSNEFEEDHKDKPIFVEKRKKEK